MESESRKLRAKQVGMLMRAYRLGYSLQQHGGRLSQTALIELMAEQDPLYCEKYDHSTVSRWERGIVLPTTEHLEVFGSALNLTPTEIDGLMTLAGLYELNNSAPNGTLSVEAALGTSKEDTAASPAPQSSEDVAVVAAERSSFETRTALRYVVSHFLIPGSAIGVAGYILASYNLNAPWLLGVYVGLVLGLVTLQGFLRMRHSGSLQELLFITVFFLLSVHLLHGPLTYMDPYGLYAVGNFAGTTIPFTLSILVNLLVALVAALLFAFLSKWQHSKSVHSTSPLSRAAWVVLPSVGFVYVSLLPFSNVGFWILGFCELAITAGALIAILVLREESVSIGDWDKKFLLYMSVSMTMGLAALGIFAALITFTEPSLLANSGNTLLYSWENDFEPLGYPADELVERYRHAVFWTSLVLLSYMVFVVGGKLIATIYGLHGGDSHMSAAPSGMTQAVAASRQRLSRRSQLDIRLWLRSLDRRRGARFFDAAARVYSYLSRERTPAMTTRLRMHLRSTDL